MGKIAHLECFACHHQHDPSAVLTICPDCGSGPLLVRYDLDAVARSFQKQPLRDRAPCMWRYHELLPVENPSNIVTLGEGYTPLIKLERLGAELGLYNLFLKDEGLCPTGSFKARGASACVSRLKELGVTTICLPTAGNAGSAFAAYGARANMQVHIAMPSTAPSSVKKQGWIFGAAVHFLDGPEDKCAEFMDSEAKRNNWFNVQTFREPWRVEGKKSMGFELFEQFNGDLPDTIFYPTGGGIGLVAIWKAFEELEALGWLKQQRTRMISVQAEGSARLVKALEEGKSDTEIWPNITTKIPGLAGPAKGLGDAFSLSVLRKSGGTGIAVSDREIMSDFSTLADKEGLFVCPEGAATLSALRRAKDKGLVDPDERIVLLNTGNGLKYLEYVGKGE